MANESERRGDFLDVLDEDDGRGEVDAVDNYSSSGQPLDAEELRHHLRSIGVTLVIRQLPSEGLSFQLWPAASSLVSLLDTNPAALLSPAPRRILELGAGTGLLGMAAAAVFRARVTLTDLPHVLPNLRSNALANAAAVESRGGSLDVKPLRWGCGEDAAPEPGDSAFDLVLASDVVYHDHLFDPLLETLGLLLKGETTKFVMAHLRRWKKRESVFFRRARKLFDITVVHKCSPPPGCRTGVTVYLFMAKHRKQTNL